MVPPASVFAGPFILMFLPLWTFIPLAKIAWILKSKFGECFLLAVFFGVFGVHRIYITRFIDGKSPPFEGEIWLRCGATLAFLCFAFFFVISKSGGFACLFLFLFLMMVIWGVMDAVKLYNTMEEFIEYRKKS